MINMNIELIKLFNKALVEDNSTKLSIANVNYIAMQHGYLVHPDICNSSVMAFIESTSVNPNATFYKSWQDIVSKNRFELFLDQISHYMSIYGTDYTLDGNGYVPNDGEIDFTPIFNQYKVILPITENELFDRCYNMLCSGVALAKNTMITIADYIINNYHDSFNIDNIKNKEALVYICNALNIYPSEKFNLFRYIIYVTTGETMIINNDALYKKIVNSSTPFNFNVLNDVYMTSLASIFLRFKKLFIAFKHNNSIDNSAKINKLRRLAVKYHTPMKQGFWQTVFSEQKSEEELTKHIEELTNYKKIAIMQTCLKRIDMSDNQNYLIRNQKVYVRTNYKPNNNNAYNMLVYVLLRNSVINSIKKYSTKIAHDKDGNEVIVPKTVKIINGVNIALPTSEKSFIGNYPYGTSYEMTNNNYIGIYWKNEWGTHDYDLSAINKKGNKVGWNAAYVSYNDNNTNIIYSGDMINADPEATELLYFKKGCDFNIIKVNQYNGNNISKYRLFFGQQEISNLHENYMVDPSTIKLNIEIKHEKIAEQLVGITNGNKMVLMAINTGNNRVSRYNKYHDILMDNILRDSNCFIYAEDILKDAGFNIVDETYNEDVDIDFSNLDKDSLISIMQ